MPFWFYLIQQWKEMEKGEYGITFPFLIGAISVGESVEANRELVIDTFSEMENSPVDGYYCEVRWCGNINEPVASMKPLDNLKKVSIKGILNGKGQVSFGFTTDLMSMFNLNCETPEQCREKLIKQATESTKTGLFSKNNGAFTSFTTGDIEFIKKVKSMTIT